MKTTQQVLVLAFSVLLWFFYCAPPCLAALYAVAPTASNFGFFPIWYQDAHASHSSCASLQR